MKKATQIISMILIIAISIGFLPQTDLFAATDEVIEEIDIVSNNAFDYTLFTKSHEEAIWFNTNKTTISGDVHSNKDIAQKDGELKISGTAQFKGEFINDEFVNEIDNLGKVNQSIVLHNIYEDIKKSIVGAKTYNDEKTLEMKNILLRNPIVAKSNLNLYAKNEDWNKTINGELSEYFNGYIGLSNSILSEGSINIFAESFEANSGIVIASQRDITIRVKNFNFTGVLYAPNGRITIYCETATINGRIYADSFQSHGGELNIISGENDKELLSPELTFIVNKKNLTFNEEIRNYETNLRENLISGQVYSKKEIESISYSVDNINGNFKGEIEIKENWIIDELPLNKGINGVKITVKNIDGLEKTETLSIVYTGSGPEIFMEYIPSEEEVFPSEDLPLEETDEMLDDESANKELNDEINIDEPLEGIEDSVNVLESDDNSLTTASSSNSLAMANNEEDTVYTPTTLPDGIVYDEIIEGDWVVSAGTTKNNTKILVTGDLIINATLNINGNSIIHVQGSTVINGNTTTAANALLYVDGDLRIQKIEGNSYTTTSASLSTSGITVVKGDFYAQTTAYSSTNTGLIRDLSILELHGDFYQIGATNNFRGHYARNSTIAQGKIIFVGEEEQYISFDRYDTSAIMGRIAVANQYNRINLLTPVYGMLLTDDITINGDANLLGVNTNEQTLTVNGNLILYGAITANGKLIVNNDLSFSAASTTFSGAGLEVIVYGNLVTNTCNLSISNGALLDVHGDMRLQTDNGDGTYSKASTGLVVNSDSRVIVRGTFYTQTTYYSGTRNVTSGTGILELKGNFAQLGTSTESYFSRTSGSTILFSGTEDQHVSFTTPNVNCGLGGVLIEKESGGVYFDTRVCQLRPLDDIELKGPIDLSVLLLNGFTITVDGDLYMVGGATSAGKIVVTGNFMPLGSNSFSNADFELCVQGDFIIGSGSVTVSNGAILDVYGDMRLQNDNGDGTYSGSTGYIQIFSYSKAIVRGDFYTQTTYYKKAGEYFAYASGILELYGDFKQLGTTSESGFGNYNLYPGTIIFKGSQDQHISFDAPGHTNRLGKILIDKEDGDIYLDTLVYYLELTANTEIKGNAYLESVRLQGFTLTVDGDLKLSASTIAEGDLIVKGNLSIISGEIAIKGQSTVFVEGDVDFDSGNIYTTETGRLEVEGDIRVQKRNNNGTFSATTGGLTIGGDSYVICRGDFYTQTTYYHPHNDYFLGRNGTFELKGNFTQLGTSSESYFRHLNSTSKIIFSGENPQHISFSLANSYNTLGCILNLNQAGSLYFDTPVYGLELITSTTIKGNRVSLLGFKDNGFVLTIDGNFFPIDDINSYIEVTGDIVIEDYNINVKSNVLLFTEGDLRIQTKNSNNTFEETSGALNIFSNSLVIVRGNLYTQSTEVPLSIDEDSLLELHGNLYQIGEETKFKNTLKGGILFAGEEDQHISFDRCDNETILGYVSLRNDPGENRVLILDTPVSGLSLLTNTSVKSNNGDDVELYGAYTNGYVLHIDKNLIAIGGSFYGIIDIPGNLIIEKTSAFADGLCEVDGDLRIQKRNGDGSFSQSNGHLILYNNGRIQVNGQFYSETEIPNEIEENCIIFLRNNLYAYGESNVFEIPESPAAFKGFIFFGEQPHQIVAESNNIGFGYIAQNSISDYITIPNPIGGFIAYGSNVTIHNPVYITDHIGAMGDIVLRFKDDLTLAGSVGMPYSYIVCEKDAIITGDGAITPYRGAFMVAGNLYLFGKGKILTGTDEDMVLVRGNIYNESISNSALSKGILEFGGSYYQYSYVDFISSALARVQIRGSATSTDDIINEGDGRIYFDTIYLLDKDDSYYPFIGRNPKVYGTYRKGNLYNTNYFWKTVANMEDSSLDLEISGIPEYSLTNEYASIERSFFGFSGIHAPSGNYSRTYSVMTFNTVLGEVEFSHTYNSLSNDVSVVGKGFNFSHDIRIITDSSSPDYKMILMPGGSTLSFQETTSGVFKAMNSRNKLTLSGGNYILTTLENSKFVFSSSGYITYIEDNKGNRINISTNSNGNVTGITDDSGTSISINYSNEKISRITNNYSGQTVSYSYNGDLLISSTDTGGRITRYEYNAQNMMSKVINNAQETVEEMTYLSDDKKISTIKDATGNIKTYQYDDLFRKVTITDSNGHVETQKYDMTKNVVSTDSGLGQEGRVDYELTNGQNLFNEIKSNIDAYGNKTVYTRDANGRVTKITYPDNGTEQYTYDNKGNVTKYIDKNGAATFHIYDGNNNLLKTAKPINGTTTYSATANQDLFIITTYTYYAIGENGTTINGLVKTETGPLGDTNNYIKYEYNSKGLPTKMIVYMDGVPYTTTYTYNSRYELTKEVAPDGVITEYVYNASGELLRTKIISANQQQQSVERTVYDSMGRVVQEIAPNQYNPAHDIVSQDQYLNSSAGTRYEYNDAGFIISKTDPLGNVITIINDSYGNVVKEVMPNGSYVKTTYDEINRKTGSSFYDHTTQEEKLMEVISYDKAGVNKQVTTTVYLDDNKSSTIIEKYDFDNRLVEKTNAEGNTSYITYTKNGDVSTEKDYDNQVTTYTYDKLGNLTNISAPFEGTKKSNITYIYDKNGNVLTEKIQSNAVNTSAASYRNISYEYDCWGNLLTTIQYEGTSPVSYIQAFYNYKGQILRQYKGLSAPLTIVDLDLVATNGDDDYSVTKYEYDYLGNIIQTIDAQGGIETFTRDSIGNVISSVDKIGHTYAATYDALGRVITENYVNINAHTANSVITKIYSYDNMGNLISLSENSNAITYTYDGFGNLLSETSGDIIKEFTYDNIGSLLSSKILDNGQTLQHIINTYDNMNRLVSVNEDGVVKASYTYDKFSNLLTTTYANGAVETNTYNRAGLIKTTVNKNANGNVLSSYTYTYNLAGNELTKVGTDGTTAYQYDDLNRLTKVTYSDASTEAYTFDENNNRLSKTVTNSLGTATTTYTYNNLDQLLEKTDDDGTIYYEYDDNGNLKLERLLNNEYITYDYDQLNRLLVWAHDSEVYFYSYNPNNSRATKGYMTNRKETEHIWLGSEIAIDKNVDGVVKYTHGLKLIESDYGTYLYNSHGDVVQLLDDTGAVIANYDYDPYGTLKTENVQGDKNPYRYTGEYLDFESGFIYLRARYYNPELGRFITEDALKDGSNWYAYCAGNPVMFIDPSGNSLIGLFAAALVTAAVAMAIDTTVQFIQNGNTFVGFNYDRQAAVGLASFSASFVMAVAAPALAPSLGALGSTMAAGGLSSVANYAVYNTYMGNEVTLSGTVSSFVTGAVIAGLFYGADKLIGKGLNFVKDKVSSSAGYRDASRFLKSSGIPKQQQKEILNSFDKKTMSFGHAGNNNYGLRFYGGNANKVGPYLFETFTPQTNRANLALPYSFNKMSGIQQFQVKPGTPIITGHAAPQYQYGSQYIGGAKQTWVFNPWDNLLS